MSAPDAPAYQLFVCAYGAGRAETGFDPGREYRILDSVLNLFDYSVPLLDTELTLRRLKDTLSKSRYEATKAGLKRILSLAPEDDLRPGQGGGVEVAACRAIWHNPVAFGLPETLRTKQ